MKRLLLLLLFLPLPMLAEQNYPKDGRGSIAAATSVVITPDDKNITGQVYLGKNTSGTPANLSWTLWRSTCNDCDEESMASGTAANLPVTYGGLAGYSYRIEVSAFTAGTLYYRVVTR